MKRATKSLLSLPLSHKILSQTNSSLPIKRLSVLRLLSSKTTKTSSTLKDQFPTKCDKDSSILENFRQRKLQGSLKTTTQQDATTNSSATELRSKNEGGLEGENKGSGPTKVVSSFEELGLKEEVAMAAGEMNVWFPSEIQCVGIPAILAGKSVVLSSDSGSGRTLAYLFPLVQLLRRDEALSSMKANLAKHPRAIVLYTTAELSDEGFRVAKLISDFARLTSARESGSEKFCPEDVLDAPIGMLIGTPCEVAQQIEEGSVVTDNIKYLVLDEADAMLDHGFGPEINKIISPLKNHESESNDRGLQTVLVTSTMSKILGESEVVKCLEHDNGGKVTAMLLEMDQMEAFEIIESPDGLKKKMAEAIDSFTSGS